MEPEITTISKKKQTNQKWAFRLQLITPAWELAEFLTISNTLVLLLDKKNVSILYVIVTLFAIIISMYALLTHFKHLMPKVRMNRFSVWKSVCQNRFLPDYQKDQPAIEAAKPSNETIEFKIRQSKKKASYLRKVLLLAGLEDLPLIITLGFYLYEATKSFSVAHTSSCSNRNLTFYEYEETQDTIRQSTIQIFVCTWGLIYKLTHFRDLNDEFASIKEYKREIEKKIELNNSILDTFTDVTEDEIRKVLLIREMLSENSSASGKALPGMLSDVLILEVLRFQKYEELATTQYLKSWLKWREKHKCDQVRETIFQNSFPFSNLPSLLSCVFSGFVAKENYDYKQNKLIVYHYGGSLADTELLSHLSEEEIVKRFIYDAEYFDILLQHLSIETKSIVSMVLIGFCGSGTSKAAESAFQKLKVLREVPVYPHFLSMKAYIPSYQEKRHIKWISYIGSENTIQNFASASETYSALCGTVSDKFIPKSFSDQDTEEIYASKALSNKLELGNLGDAYKLKSTRRLHKRSKAYKTNEDTSKYPASHQDTERKEVDNNITQPEGENTELDPWGLKIYVPQTLAQLTTEFSELFLFSDVTMIEAENVQKFRVLINETVGEGELKKQPQTFSGDINLLRILRMNDFEFGEAVRAFNEILEIRKRYNLTEINKEIVSNNLRINQLPHWKEYISFKPSLGVIERDRSGNILIQLNNFRHFNVSLLNAEYHEKVIKFQWYFFEYLSIIIDFVSRSERRMASIVKVTDAKGAKIRVLKQRLSTLKAHETEESNSMKKAYEFIFHRMHIIWGVPAKRFISVLEKISKTKLVKSTMGSHEFEFYFATENGEKKFRQRFGIHGIDMFQMAQDELKNWKYPSLQSLERKLRELNVDDPNSLSISGFYDVSEREVAKVLQMRKEIILALGRNEFNLQPQSFLGSLSLLRALRKHNYRRDVAVEQVMKQWKLRRNAKMHRLNRLIRKQNMSIKKVATHLASLGGSLEVTRDRNGNILLMMGCAKNARYDALAHMVAVDVLCYEDLGGAFLLLGVSVIELKATQPHMQLTEIFRKEYLAILIDELSRLERRVLNLVLLFDDTNEIQNDVNSYKMYQQLISRKDCSNIFSYYEDPKQIHYVVWGASDKDGNPLGLKRENSTLYLDNSLISEAELMKRFGIASIDIGIGRKQSEVGKMFPSTDYGLKEMIGLLQSERNTIAEAKPNAELIINKKQSFFVKHW